MILTESHLVPFLEASVRLQEYAVGIFKTIGTKSGMKKAIKKNLVFVDKNIATTALFINGGETIELYQIEDKPPHKSFQFDLEVLFEDAYLALVYKPAGILVSGNSFFTIDNALTQNLKKSTQIGAVRPRPVHRLDYPTSGILLVGKTSKAIIALNKLFEKKEIKKQYHAISIGVMESKGTIDLAVDDKEAFTSFKILETVVSKRFGYLNLVELSPKTGRRHQLRKHLSLLGNQILGDKEYGDPKLILKGKGMYLHASSLKFTHPFTKEKMDITKELPEKFYKIFP